LKKVHSGVDDSKQALHQVRFFLWFLAAKNNTLFSSS